MPGDTDISLLHDYLKVVALLNSPDTRSQALESLASEGSDRSFETLRALLPYLSLPTLLSLRSSHKSLGQVITETLYDLIDAQRDWVVSPECPAELRDAYLVHVFGKEWDETQDRMDEVASAKLGQIKKTTIVSVTGKEKEEGICATLSGFETDLREATGGLLKNVDWSNVIIGGGAVLSILSGKTHDETYANSDVDLFLFGLKPDELLPKVAALIEEIQSALPRDKPGKKGQEDLDSLYRRFQASLGLKDDGAAWTAAHKDELLIVKGFNAITLVPPKSAPCRRKIQIVLQHHASVFDALAWFDLDACAVGYTGKAVVALPRAVRSQSLSNDWRGGINFFDPWLARKGDSSGNMLASRVIKYQPRGFALALAPAAAAFLQEQGVKLSEQLTSALVRTVVNRDAPLYGLAALFRREQVVRDNAEKAALRKAAMFDYGYDSEESAEYDGEDDEDDYYEHDYGFGRRASRRARFESEGMDLKDNAALLEDYWNYNMVDVTNAVQSLMSQIEVVATMFGSETDPVDRGKQLADLLIPYVSSFDGRGALGLKPEDLKASRVPSLSETALSMDVVRSLSVQLRSVQYIVRLPASALPLFDRAEQKMRDLVERLRSGKGDAVSPPALAQDFPEAVSQSLNHVLASVPSVAAPDLADIKADHAKPLKAFVPECFPGPARREAKLGPNAFSLAGSEETAETHHLLTPLATAAASGEPEGRWVYRVATIAGLWQIRGLDADIDKALNILWEAWTIFSHIAVTLPEEASDKKASRSAALPTKLQEQDATIDDLMPSSDRPGARHQPAQQQPQPNILKMLTSMHRSLSTISDAAVRDDARQKSVKVDVEHHWTGDRARWLEQWLKGEEMV